MQNIKKTLKSKRFWLGTVLPFALAVAAAFVARYQLEISDGVTANYMAGQWPVYAPLNALTAFCLTLVVFALCGSWGIATGVSGLIFTVLALVNYYTRDLHGSALMPQDILNLGTAAEVMGSYTLHITQTVITIALLYIPVLVAAVVQVKLAGKHKRSWKQRGAHALACACGIFAVLYLGYFSPNPIKPATTYGWAWQETYYKYGYLAGSLEAASLMVDPILQPDGYSEDAATEAAAMAQDYQASPETANEQDYPDVFLILSESFYDFDLVTDLQADQKPAQLHLRPHHQPACGRRHQLQRVRDAFLQLADADALHHTVQLVEPAQGKQPGQQPERSGVCHAGSPPLYQLQLPPRFCLADAGL